MTELESKIREWLYILAVEQYPQADEHYAHKSKKGKWHWGSSNHEYENKFGSGYNNILSDGMIKLIYNEQKVK